MEGSRNQSGLFTEITYISEPEALDSITPIRSREASGNNFCEIVGSPANYSPLTDNPPLLAHLSHSSSGCIEEIRSLTYDEAVTKDDSDVGAKSEVYFEVFEETVCKTKNCSHQADSSSRSDDEPDGPSDLTLTSRYLPKNSLRHVETTLNLSKAVSPTSEDDADPSAERSFESEEIDYTQVASWREQRRHLFILSDSGKPIYSRHGDEDKLVTLCGVMQALVSVVADDKDNHLWSIQALGTRVSFLSRSHLLIVTVAKTAETDRQLMVYLNYAYDFILSVLTLPQLERIFNKYQNFDLRRMLSGTEKILDRLIDWFEQDMAFLLGSVRCLSLPSLLRDTINAQLVHSCHKMPGLVFAVMIAKRQLISVARLKKYVLHPSDIHLLINLIDASESFKTAESWIPICLPKFDARGFLHAYITYLKDSPVCLVYLSVNPDSFHVLAKSAASLISKLDSSKALDGIISALSSTAYYNISACGVAEIRHFVYKSATVAQLTSPIVSQPYIHPDLRHELLGFYRYMHHLMHCPNRPSKILVVTSATELLLGWVTSSFEVYVVLEPFLTKHQAVLSVEKLIKWIKREEQQLFILNSPVFS